jgi:hypothetical protein
MENRLMNKSTLLSMALLMASLGLACSDDGDNNNKICAPGATQVCACPGGTQGVQTCNITGASWSTCNCGSNPKLDSGGGNVCVPGTTKGCTCSGGINGVQNCNQDGKGYSTCDCSKLDGGGTVKYDKGGQPPKKSVGKFCHNLVDKNNKTITMTLKLGSGSNMISLSAWTGACSTVVGVQCHQMPVGNNMPLEVWYDGQVIAQGSGNVGPGEEWVIVLTMDNGNPKLISGPLKTGFTCQSYNPFK